MSILASEISKQDSFTSFHGVTLSKINLFFKGTFKSVEYLNVIKDLNSNTLPLDANTYVVVVIHVKYEYIFMFSL